MLGLLGEAAGRTLLLAAILQGGLRLLRVQQARTLLAAWSLVLAVSLAMPGLPSLTPFRVAVEALPIEAAVPLGSDVAGEREVPVRTLADAGSSGSGVADAGSWWAVLPWLEGVYLLVAGVIAFRVLLGVVLSLRLLGRAVPVRASWAAGVRVRISREVAAPVTIGRLVVLPPDAPGWSGEMRRAVLAHERAHVVRWDFALLLLSQLNKAVFWFSPLPWWLHRRLTLLSELACDDHAMAVLGDPVGYAAVLLEMGRRPATAFRGPAMARPATLALRIERILREEPGSGSFDWVLRVVLMAVVPGLALAVAGLVADPIGGPISGPTAEPAPVPFAGAAVGQEEVSGPPSPVRAEARGEEMPVAGLRGTVRETPTIVVPAPAATRAAAGQRPMPATRSVQHVALRPVARAVPPPRARPAVRDGERAAGNDGAGAPAATRDVVGRAPAQQVVQVVPLPSPSPPPPPSARLDFQAMMQSTCTGTIIMGPRARELMSPRPDVAAGQVVAAQAQFFRKNGATWVRFIAFDRPPLDLPVQVTQNKATWTGEYGINYAVQPLAENRLVGLAALLAADSALLDFTCGASAG